MIEPPCDPAAEYAALVFLVAFIGWQSMPLDKYAPAMAAQEKRPEGFEVLRRALLFYAVDLVTGPEPMGDSVAAGGRVLH